MLKNRERLTSLTPLLIFAWVVFIYACNSSGKERKNKAPKDDWDASIIGSFSAEEYKSFDPQKIDSFEAKHPDFSFEDSVLHHFYSNRNYSYAWFDKYGLIEQAGYLINRISNLKQEGIYTEPLYKKELDSLVALHENGKEADLTLEIMLTAQYFDFARKVWEGMGTQQSEASEWFVPRKRLLQKIT